MTPSCLWLCKHRLEWQNPSESAASQSVPLVDGILIVAVGMVFFALIETEKQMRLVFRSPEQDNRPRFSDDQMHRKHVSTTATTIHR